MLTGAIRLTVEMPGGWSYPGLPYAYSIGISHQSGVVIKRLPNHFLVHV
jgi:hypothetical protein